MTTTYPPAPTPAPASPRPRHAVVATTWGLVAMAAGVVPVALLGWLLRPRESRGFAELGWLLGTFLLAVVVGAVAGSVAVGVGLRRAGCRHAVAVALVFVPVALLGGAVTAGAGALAAPAAAHWIVGGFVRRREDAPADGRGPRFGGVPQRAVVAVAAVLLAAHLVPERLPDVAGERNGGLLLWAMLAPVLALPVVLLLLRRVPAVALLAAVAVAAGVGVLPVRERVATAHPSPERLSDLVADVDAPAGVVVTDRIAGAVDAVGDPALFVDQPVVVLATSARGAEEVVVPAALRPGADGSLPERSPLAEDVSAVVAAPSAGGLEVAQAWRDALTGAGWEVDPSSTPERRDTGGDSYWLPDPAAQVVDAGEPLRLTRGPWVRASVVPTGDGALIVVSVRP